MIDWTDPSCAVSAHFTVHECTWLPTDQTHYVPNEDEQADLIRTCALMEKVRDLFQQPVNVHVMIRPAAYNKKIGGAPNSAHIFGLACDFDVAGENCDDVREKLAPLLSDWNCRMERAPGTNWVHLDLHAPNPNRYFIP